MLTRDAPKSFDFQHLIPSDLSNKKMVVDSRSHQMRKNSSSKKYTRRRNTVEEPSYMQRREDLRSYDNRRLKPSNASKNNMRKEKLDFSAHNTTIDFSTHTTRGRNKQEEVDDDDLSYYSHSDISLPAYGSTQIGIGLQMVDCCGSSSNPCKGGSKYAIVLLSLCTIFQTCRIYGLNNDMSISGSLRALNMSKNDQQVHNSASPIPTSDTMSINSMSSTSAEKGEITPMTSSGGSVAGAMENFNGIMTPKINNSITANNEGVGMSQNMNMQLEQPYSNENINTMGSSTEHNVDGSSNMNGAMVMSQQRPHNQKNKQEIDPFAKFLSGGYASQIKPPNNGMNGNTMNEGLQNRTSQRGRAVAGSQDTTTSTTDTTDKKTETQDAQDDKISPPSPTKSPSTKSLSSYGTRNSSYGTSNFTYTGGSSTTTTSEDKISGSEIGGASGGYAD